MLWFYLSCPLPPPLPFIVTLTLPVCPPFFKPITFGLFKALIGDWFSLNWWEWDQLVEVCGILKASVFQVNKLCWMMWFVFRVILSGWKKVDMCLRVQHSGVFLYGTWILSFKNCVHCSSLYVCEKTEVKGQNMATL